jgi:hypothetical protein
MSKKTKRVLLASDTHCGASAGLTPKAFDNRRDKWRTMRRKFWREYEKTIDSLGKIDLLIFNGDAIDGPSNTKEAGIGLLHADRNIQVDMAIECIQRIGADKVVMTRGTQYHTGDREDYEDQIADKVGAVAISSREWVEVNGVVFDCKHKIAGSSIPHGAFTSIAKSNLWNALWAEVGLQPRANIFVRSHVHSFSFCGNSQYTAVVTPSLQGYSRYGSLSVERLIDWGLVWFDIEEDGSYKMDYNIVRIQEAKAKVVKI